MNIERHTTVVPNVMRDALNEPAASVSPATAVAAETCATFALVLVILVMVSHRRLTLTHRFVTPFEAETGKLLHDFRYRSIFTGRADHAAKRHLERQAAGRPGSRPPLRAA
jgi:hypothetical protein